MANRRSWRRCYIAGKFFLVLTVYLVGLAGLAILAAAVAPPGSRDVPETSWTELHLVESAEITGPIAAAVILGMIASVVIDKLRRRDADLRFYPLWRRVGGVIRNGRSRAVVAVGSAVLASYLVAAFTAPRFFDAISGGRFWPADIVLVSLLWIWASVWLAETVAPPVRTPVAAALVVGASSLFLGCCPSARPVLAKQYSNGTTLPIRSASDLLHEIGCLIEIECRNVCDVPSWATETQETEHFIYHYEEGDNPIIASLEAQEQHYAFFKKTFGVDLPRKIHYVKYPDRAYKSMAARGYVHSRRWFDPHEAVHSYLIPRNYFLREGIAHAFGGTFELPWDDYTYKPVKVDEQRLHEAMDRLLDVPDEDRDMARNLVLWLYYRYGPEKLVTILRQSYCEGSRTRDVMARVCGVSFSDLAAQWQRDQEWLHCQPAPAGFFTYSGWDERAASTD